MKGDGVQIGLAVNAQVRALQASAARLSTFVVMGQPLQSLATQLTHAYDAQRGIDGLVVDLESVGHKSVSGNFPPQVSEQVVHAV